MIVLINPNSTAAMTQAMLQTARQTVPTIDIEGWTSHDGPPAIQGEADGVAASAPLLELVKKASAQGADCIIIGCFDDTALPEARALADCPVIGIGQAAYTVAALAGGRFSVVTTLAVSVQILEDNIRSYGLWDHLGRVHASNVPVLALESDPEASARAIEETVRKVIAEDKVQTVVLGCGGMVDIEQQLAHLGEVKFIDGVRAATHIAAALV